MSNRLTEWSHERDDRRLLSAYVGSGLFHLLLMGGLWWVGPLTVEEPEEKRISIELIAQGHGPSPHSAAVEQPPSSPPPQPAKPSPSPKRPVAPLGTYPMPQPDLDLSAPTPQPQPVAQKPTTSFADYQKAQMEGVPLPSAGGRGGTDLATSKGKDKCEPARSPQLVILLYDASGSMADMRRAQGIHCARQYARSAIEQGAQIVVGSFGLNAAFSPPTRSLADIDIALRSPIDGRGTVLPTRQLFPWIDRDPDAVVDLVIVSDGYIPPSREVVDAYRYFLDLNPKNRGVMYTVGMPGQRAIEAELKNLGFDVFVYQQMGGG